MNGKDRRGAEKLANPWLAKMLHAYYKVKLNKMQYDKKKDVL